MRCNVRGLQESENERCSGANLSVEVMFCSIRKFAALCWAIIYTTTPFALHPGADAEFGINAIATVETAGYSGNGSGATNAIAHANGNVTIATMQSGGFAVVRLLANGNVDPSFNGGAARVVTETNGVTGFTAVGVDAANRTVVVGSEYDTFHTILVIYRLTVSGQLDPAFGIGGRLRTVLPVNLVYQGVVPSVATAVISRLSGGFFLIAGQGSVVAFDDTGSLDVSVWTQGIFQTSLFQPGPNSVGSSHVIAVTGDGSVYVAEPVDSSGMFHARRIRSDSTVDGNYGGLFGSPSGGLPSLGKFDSLGRLYFLHYNYYGGISYSLVRLRFDGTLDGTYGTDGYWQHAMNNWMWQSPSALDVSSDGRAVISAAYSSQQSSAGATFLLVDATGQTSTMFGGRGATRVEQAGYGYSGFAARRATFTPSGDRLIVFGNSELGSAISAIRRRLDFTHQISVANLRTLPLNPKYGDYVRFSVDVDGDQGRPQGTITVRVNGTELLCVESLFASANDPNHTETCGTDRIAAGPVLSTLEFSGDEIYLPTTVPGPSAQVGRARFTVVVGAMANQPQLPKDRFTVSLGAWVTNSDGYLITSPMTGQFSVTDGVTNCVISAALLATFPRPTCEIVLTAPGSVRLFVQHLGDSNFEPDTIGETFVMVAPAVLSLPLADSLSNANYAASVTTNDPNCGLKYSSTVYLDDRALPAGAVRALARNGGFYVSTVSDCTAGFAGTLNILMQSAGGALSAA